MHSAEPYTKRQKLNEDPSEATNDLAAIRAADSTPTGHIQIVDLHSANPLISYNNNFYSCHWATELGSTLFFAPPPADGTDTDHLAQQSFRSFDLLGTSSSRLVGVPATLKPRITPLETLQQQTFLPFSRDDQSDITRTAEGDTIINGPQGLRIDLPTGAAPQKVSQARFLEQLARIKKARGEKDNVAIKPIKSYTAPEGWEKIRDAAIAEAAADRSALASGKGQGPEDVTTKRPRGPTGRPPGRPRQIVIEKDAGQEEGAEADETVHSEQDHASPRSSSPEL